MTPAPPEAPRLPPPPPALFSQAAVLAAIVLNTLCLFLDGFPAVRAQAGRLFLWLDVGFILYFAAEAVEKLMRRGVAGYFASGWNRFDFTILILSLPGLAAPFADMHAFATLLILRLGRIVRFVRVFRFVPNGERIWGGVVRALQSSVAVFFALALLNLVLGMVASQLYAEISPAHFGNPLVACYTVFKIFTIEGWYGIPEELAAHPGAGSFSFMIHLFFVGTVLVGILAISLANAVFVDEMTSDNTHALERQVAGLEREIRALAGEVRGLRGELAARGRERGGPAAPPAADATGRPGGRA